jgi:anti-sigma-K factor RskA
MQRILINIGRTARERDRARRGRAGNEVLSARLCLWRFLEIAAAAVPAIPISAAVPATTSSPSSPCLVIVPLAVGISRIRVLAISLLRGMARAGDPVLGHCGP